MATGGAPANKCFACQDKVATALCVDCGDELCKSCVTGHAMHTGSKQHDVHDLSALTPQSLAQTEASVSARQATIIALQASASARQTNISAAQAKLSEEKQRLEQIKAGVAILQSRAPTVSTASPSQDQQDWGAFITAYYPDYLTRTHCVPPVHFNRVAYQDAEVEGLPVLVTLPVGGTAAYLPDPNQPAEEPSHQGHSQPSSQGQSTSVSQGHSTPVPPRQSTPMPPVPTTPSPHKKALPTFQESDVRDDFAQHHVLHNLLQFGESQSDGMFILSQLEFSKYLDQPCYAATASLLPTPSHLGRGKGQGDFDVLVFHRKHGVLVGEIKSVGLTGAPSDAAVAKRVKRAAEQLEKSGEMVQHLLQDVAPRIPVRKALILPYVTRSQLLSVLQNDANLEQEVCRIVKARDAAEAVAMSVCCEELSAPASPWRVEGSELAELTRWWNLGVANNPCPVMTDQLYLDIVARFVGPATTVSVHCVSSPRVEVRTRGQAVSELGRRVACLVLTPRQLHILTRQPAVLPPIASPPVVSPPIASPPVVSPPIASPPVVSPPIASPPVVSPPIASPPVVSPPIASPPVVSPPIASPPVVLPPIALPPVVSPPIASPPMVLPTAASPPSASPPVVSPPAASLLTDRVALVGPPGTGKTIVLGLTGRRWLYEGHDVQVLSLRAGDVAASHLLAHQLQKTVDADHILKASAVQVKLHDYDFACEEGDVERAIRELVAASAGRQLCVLIDETTFNPSEAAGRRSQRFVAALIAAVPTVCLWTACVYHDDIPAELHTEALTFALRCAPAVRREVATGVSRYPETSLHPYSQEEMPSPADGPTVLHLHHKGVGHTGVFPDECLLCGLELARVFKELGVGGAANPPSPHAPAPLQYRDVFVLTRSYLRQDSGVARGLRQAGVPVCVTGLGTKPNADVISDLRAVAVAYRNEVTVTGPDCVTGLERKVVVWLHGRREGEDDGHSAEVIQTLDRVHAVSRCTTQLIVVHAV